MRFFIYILALVAILTMSPAAEAGHHHGCYRGHHGYRVWGGASGCGVGYYRSSCSVGYAWGAAYAPTYYSFYAAPYSFAPYYGTRCYAPLYRHYYYAPRYYWPGGFNTYYFAPTYFSTGTSRSISPVEKFAYSTPIDDALKTDVAVRSRITTFRSTLDTNARAREMIALGDAAFREGRFVDALTRYRDAANRSPNYAEAWFRKGHAYLANGQHRLAANAFREGYKIEPEGMRDGFRLKDIYVKHEVFHRHLESLAAAALADDTNAEPHYLLGVLLRYNGESDRAEKFFAAAASIESGMRAPEFSPGVKVLRLAESPRSDYEI